MSNLTPALQVPIDGIFLADLFGFILALPTALFLAYWLSSVKSKAAVVIGALIGAFIGFFVILAWAGTLIFDTPLPNANGGAVFFGSLLFCSIMGLIGAIIMDLLIARANRRDYQ